MLILNFRIYDTAVGGIVKHAFIIEKSMHVGKIRKEMIGS